MYKDIEKRKLCWRYDKFNLGPKLQHNERIYDVCQYCDQFTYAEKFDHNCMLACEVPPFVLDNEGFGLYS